MPELRAFAGIRYSSRVQLPQVVCPPYDVISPDEQGRLHERDPHNAVRLELAEPAHTDNKYAHVGKTFENWLRDGVLQTDPEDSLYVYRQDFMDANGDRHRVAGVIGALTLEPFGGSHGVLPHERTMPGPKQDRLALMRACPANISPIYSIYRGGGELGPLFDSLELREAHADFDDDAGIRHRLWAVSAPADIKTIAEALDPGPLVIADGHHRYETALAFHDEMDGEAGDHDSIMCFCVDADSEGLVVLPYHRVVRSSLPTAQIEERLRGSFVVGGLDGTDPQSELANSDADHAFVFLVGDSSLLVEVDDDAVVDVTGPRHPAWRALDVVALHELVLPHVFGQDIELAFSRSADEVTRLARAGDSSAGVLLRAVSATEVVDVAGSGERMPQKASYFWPKALTGLVFHSLQ